MRFLKEMIARTGPVADDGAAEDPARASFETPDTHPPEMQDPGPDTRAGGRDMAAPVDDAPRPNRQNMAAGPARPDAVKDASPDFVAPPVGASLPDSFTDKTMPRDTGDAGDINDAAAPAGFAAYGAAGPGTDPPRVWDMPDQVDPAAHRPDAGNGAPQTDADPPEPSQAELAREAMELLRARAGNHGEDPAPGPQGGRVKTRLLGFNAMGTAETDVFATREPATASRPDRFPVGWLVVTDGPGRGASFAIFDGVSQIGRGGDQAIRLDFGDTSISRDNHAAIAYDQEQNGFFFGHGGKANIVRLNGQPVLSTERLANEDQIRIGETTLRFVALCGDGFRWNRDEPGGAGVV